MASPFLVLVEGRDDREVCLHLLRRHGIETVTVLEKGGYPSLLESILTVKQSDLEVFAIVVDADLNLESRWAELSHKIRSLGYETCPKQPDPRGTIISKANWPLLGVWIMPDNTAMGKLEHFVAALIPEGDPLWPRAQQSVQDIPQEHRKFKEGILPKATIHTWLAWQEEPGTKMGEALGKKYLDPKTVSGELFIAWIRRMLEQKPSFQSEPNILG